MTPALRQQVRVRANDCCEYCRMPQSATHLPHEVDHVRALKHSGPTVLANLAWACALCNNFKGFDAAGFVPDTNELVRLFHPRIDEWSEHFQWDGPILQGITDVANATIALLRINAESRVAYRQYLVDEGIFPPATIR